MTVTSDSPNKSKDITSQSTAPTTPSTDSLTNNKNVIKNSLGLFETIESFVPSEATGPLDWSVDFTDNGEDDDNDDSSSSNEDDDEDFVFGASFR